MEFGKPQKLPDGRYFLKIQGCRKQLNKVTLTGEPTPKSVVFGLASEQIEYFKDIDSQILTQAKASKQEWFGKDLSDETIQQAYQDSDTDGSLNAALVTVKGEVQTVVYDDQKNKKEVGDLKDGSMCDIIVELSGLWFLKKSFGPIWRVIQARLRTDKKAVAVPQEYLFEDDPEPETDDPADYVD
jgi:hypothetical protein